MARNIARDRLNPSAPAKVAALPAAAEEAVCGEGGHARCPCQAAPAAARADEPLGGDTALVAGLCHGRLHWDARLVTLHRDARRAAAPSSAAGSSCSSELRDTKRTRVRYQTVACALERARWVGGSGRVAATPAGLPIETARRVSPPAGPVADRGR